MSTQVGVNPFFTPTQISGCALWLDGADPNGNNVVPNNGSIVTTWADKSGNGNNATAFTGSATFSQRSVGFTGTQSFTTPLTTVRNNQSGFMVVTHTSGLLIDIIGIRYTSGTTPGIQLVMNNNVQNIRAWGGATVATGATITVNTQFIYGYNFQGGGAAGTNFLYSNGTQTGTNSGTAPTLTGAGTVMIGAYTDNPPSAFEIYRGSINEIILYSVNLTTSQRQQIEGYLAWKWSLQASLPATHPYKSSLIPPLLNPPTTLPSALYNYTSPFLPTQISGLQLWLDAADSSSLVLSGSNVTTWRDKSGFSRNAVGFTGSGTYSANGFNAYPTIQITSSGNMRAPIPAGTFPLGIVVFVMFQKTGANNAADALVSRNVSNIPGPFDIFSGYNNQPIRTTRGVGDGGANYQVSNSDTGAVLRTTTPTIYCMNVFATSANSWLETINGTVATYVLTALSAYLDAATFFYIGTRADSFTRMNGNISEIIAYNASSFSTTQRQQVEGYLAWKWGLQANLPTSHPYRNSPITTTLFPLPRIISSMWQPTQVSGCSLWLDASLPSNFILSGSNIVTWIDRSGNGNNTTSTSNPTYSISNVVLGGTAYFSLNLNFLANASHSAYFVFSTTNYTNMYGAAQSGLTSNSFHAGFSSSNFYNLNFWTNNYSPAVTANFRRGQRNLVNWEWINNGRRSVYANGSLEGSSNAPGIIGTMASGGRIGNVTAAPTMNGILNEIVIIINTGVTTANRQQVEGYLAWKWGIQANLPSNHPFSKWPPPP